VANLAAIKAADVQNLPKSTAQAAFRILVADFAGKWSMPAIQRDDWVEIMTNRLRNLLHNWELAVKKKAGWAQLDAADGKSSAAPEGEGAAEAEEDEDEDGWPVGGSGADVPVEVDDDDDLVCLTKLGQKKPAANKRSLATSGRTARWHRRVNSSLAGMRNFSWAGGGPQARPTQRCLSHPRSESTATPCTPAMRTS